MYISYVTADTKTLNLIFSIVHLVFRNLLWLKESVKLYKNQYHRRKKYCIHVLRLTEHISLAPAHGKEKNPTVNRICFYFHYHQIPKTSLCRILNKHISDVFPISWQFENSLELNIDYISLFLRIGGNVIDSNLSITYLFYKNFLKHSANDRCSTRQRKHSHTCTRASGRNMPCKNKIA